MKNTKSRSLSVGVIAVILVLCNLASLTVIFSQILTYSQAKFEHILPMTEGEGVTIMLPAESSNDESAAESITVPEESEIINTSKENSESSKAEISKPTPSKSESTSGDEGLKKHPEFHMEAEVEIFRFSYDETGKITVIGPEGNPDKLIAPGTSNLYRFTLANTGDVPLDYILTMEAYITGTDLYIPVNARVWDYNNKYLVGSPDEMPDVMELNNVYETAELGAGRYARYYLEWEWPFERPDENGDITENDIYDTMLGDLAVDQDLFLTIVIRTIAEYDEEPDNPNTGEQPPHTGDDFQMTLMIVLCIGSFFGFIFVLVPHDRDRREEKSGKIRRI